MHDKFKFEFVPWVATWALTTVESGQRPCVLGSCVPLRRVKAFAQALPAESFDCFGDVQASASARVTTFQLE